MAGGVTAGGIVRAGDRQAEEARSRVLRLVGRRKLGDDPPLGELIVEHAGLAVVPGVAVAPVGGDESLPEVADRVEAATRVPALFQTAIPPSTTCT